jgi:phosphate starvation-inducible membrane PsiE
VLWRTGLILAVLACALAIGWSSLLLHDGSGNAWYAAPENVLRFSVFIFIGFFACQPLSYLTPPALSRRFVANEDVLLLAFVVAYAAYLAFIVGRAYFTNMHAPAETVIYCAVAAIVPAMLAASTYRHLPGGTAWRILRRAGVAYFWLIFALSGLAHFYGPHRPDRYFALSLILLIGALQFRLIASLVRSLRGASRKQAIAAE